MTPLIVYQGLGDYRLRSSEEPALVYRIGGGQVIGDFTSLNDWKRLNEYAESLRDSYAEWVYAFNDLFLRAGLVYDGLSLFFLSDFSCKRTEIFKTFSTICNLHVLREKLEGVNVSHAVLVGATPAFVDAFRSVFPNLQVTIENPAADRNDWIRRVGSDVRHFFELAVVAIANSVRLSRPTQGAAPAPRRMYFSPYPQMFSSTFSDIKYGNLVGPEDCHCVSIVMDGLHQHVAPVSFFKLRSRLQGRANFKLIDDKLALSDVLRGFRWGLAMRVFQWSHRKRQWTFAGIDVSRYVRAEWSLSFSRIPRLVALSGAFRRFFTRTEAQAVVYYLHEYPFGRMLSHVLGSHYPAVQRVGFQHGPASWRKLVYFMAKGEASAKPPYLRQVPIPDQILAEDAESRRIYEEAGYASVGVMDEIYRLGYLRPLVRAQHSSSVLIAPGLHDVRLMLDALIPVIQQNPDIQYLLKLHPRAKKENLPANGLNNLVFTEKPIQELLELVGKVYVTYSSVGLEAKALGIEVEVVNVPGVINESPLLARLT